MGKKILLLVVVVLIAASFAGYWYLKEKARFVIEERTVYSSFESFGIKLSSGEGYSIKYENRVTCFVQKLVFSDKSKADQFLAVALHELANFTSNESSAKINDWAGYEFVTLDLSTKNPSGYGIAIQKNNFLIYGSCKEKNALEEVVEWFIRQAL
ncbi:MAG: hypothetical protein HZC29_02980 [Thaumarchaeota archaeon]|nr:hypothetical protein [Nitrososphaerota archaeon]